MIVTSVPFFNIFALPKGTVKFLSVGTLPLLLYIISFSKKITGFGSLIEDFNKPFASAAFEGDTTFNPGQWAYQLVNPDYAGLLFVLRHH